MSGPFLDRQCNARFSFYDILQ
uniref:Uncharacterized protein n=1 Tax=Anguilla anguilla TaxID=7936 RepID=A0A0E9PAJ8_ANGAN